MIKIESIGHTERRNAENVLFIDQETGGCTSNKGLVATNETGS